MANPERAACEKWKEAGRLMALIERGRVNCAAGETAGRSPTAPPSHLSGAQPGRGKAGSFPLVQPNSALTSPSSPVQIAGAPNAPNSLEGRSRISSCETRGEGVLFPSYTSQTPPREKVSSTREIVKGLSNLKASFGGVTNWDKEAKDKRDEQPVRNLPRTHVSTPVAGRGGVKGWGRESK